MTDPIIGIDLGTTNSVVAVIDTAGAPQVITDAKGFKIQPSVVSFHPNGSVIVGAEAKQRRIIDPRNTVYSAKRLIGRTYRSKEVTAASARMPYKIKEGVNEQPVISSRAGEFAVPEISAIVLDHMRSIAQKALGEDVGRAVITVPANFTDAQRSATATAGAIAGLTVVRVLNEPTAAALAYGRGKSISEQVIAVFDFGGGTFDVTLLRLEDDVYEVLSTAGDTFLGGDDIDERLVDHMVQMFLQQTRTDLRADELAMQRLRAVAEQTKIELSRRSRAIVKVDEIAYGAGGAALDLQLEISRNEFISKIADIVDRAFPVCSEALKMAGLDGVDEVVLVGGTTKMPYVRERVTNFFGKPPRTDVNPDEAVAVGAAIQGDALARVLGGPARATAQRSVAPPAPPMEIKPPGAAPAPPPTPADAVSRKLAPGPRTTAQRVATTSERAAQPAIDDEEITGIVQRPQQPVPRPPGSRRTNPQFAAVPESSAPKPLARITQQGAGGIVERVRPDSEPAGTPRRRPTEPEPLPGQGPLPDDAFDVDTNAPTFVGGHPAGFAMPEPTGESTVTQRSDGPTDVADAPTNVAAAPMAGLDAPTNVAPPPDPSSGNYPPVKALPAPFAREISGVTTPGEPSPRGDSEPGLVTKPDGGPPRVRMPEPVPPPPASPRPPVQPAGPPPVTAPAPVPARARPAPSTARTGAAMATLDGMTPTAQPEPAGPARSRPAPATARTSAAMGTLDDVAPTADPGSGRIEAVQPESVPTLDSIIAMNEPEPAVSTRPPSAPVVMDIAPQGIGIGTVSGFCDELVHRNQRLPFEHTRKFTTSTDFQQQVKIRVCLGDSRRIDENVVLGQVVLGNIARQPRGQPSISVTFEVDENGILNVSAKDEATGVEQTVTLTIVGAQSEEEVAAARERFKDLISG